MTSFIPIFPLDVVVYPGEQLNLHIFEPRYKQLVAECITEQKGFGIPVVLNNEMKELGTYMQIEKVEKEYDNGEFDIRTRGTDIFRVLEMIKEVPDKLYSGAIVSYPENITEPAPNIMHRVMNALATLHQLLQVEKEYHKAESELNAYDVAHHAGLSLEQEYELLSLFTESHRQEYLNRHLQQLIPMVAEAEKLKERIRLNGHFRNLSIEGF
jgi:Lon protease-like protein